MTPHYTAREAVAAHGARSLAEHRAKTVQRFHIKSGKQFLHWSGGHLTDNPDHAWIDNETRGNRALEVFAAAAGCKLVEVGQ